MLEKPSSLQLVILLACLTRAPVTWGQDQASMQNDSVQLEDAASISSELSAAEMKEFLGEIEPVRTAPPRRSSLIDRITAERKSAQTKGLEIHGFLKSEGSTDFHSGLTSDGTDFRGLFETSVTLDLGKVFHWSGARMSASVHDYVGSNASDSLVEDVQSFSNIDSSPMNRIYELWFEQSLDEGKIRLKAGRIDANTEFAFVEDATEFLNSSMGFSPTILGLNTYPAPRTGGLVALKPGDAFSLTIGDFRCPIHGDMAIGEIGTRWKLSDGSLPGRLAFGSWIHPHNRQGYMGDVAFGVHGYYLIAEQMLWKTNVHSAEDGRGIRAFAQWGDANPMFSGITLHQGGGFEWVGPFSGRPTDVAGLGITRVRLGQNYFQLPANGSERSVESFYKILFRPWASLTVDVQRIDGSLNTLMATKPFAATLRVTFSY